MLKVQHSIRDPRIRSLLDYAFIFSIDSAHKSFNDYLYSHYGSVCYIESDGELAWDAIDCFPAPTFKQLVAAGLLDVKGMDLGAQSDTPSEDVVGVVEKLIAGGAYIYIVLDEFYLPGKPAYRLRHYIHHSLVVGFDQERRCLALLSYFLSDTADFGIRWISYDDFIRAFCYDCRKLSKDQYPFAASSRTYLDAFFVQNSDYSFEPCNMLRDVQAHLNSVAAEGRKMVHRKALPDSKVRFGLEAYYGWKRVLSEMQGGVHVNYRIPVRVFWEHKAFLLQQVLFLHGNSIVLFRTQVIEKLKLLNKQARLFRFAFGESVEKGKVPDFKLLHRTLDECRVLEEEVLQLIFRTLNEALN